MRVTIVSEVVSSEYDGSTVDAEWVAEYLAGADDSLFVPGVSSWGNVTTEQDDEGNIILSADLTTDEKVDANHPSGNGGQVVSEDWISGYIIGADAYWFAPETLRAIKVTFA